MRQFVLCLLAAVASVPAVAQPEVDPETVTYDADLFFALAGLSGAEDLAVGTAPEGLESFLPPGADVLGTRQSDNPWMGGRFATVVARSATSPESARAYYEAAAPEGWTRPPKPTRETHGFVTSEDGGPGTTFLRADKELVVSVDVRTRPEGGSILVVSMRPVFPQESFEDVPDGLGSSAQRHMPALYAPTGARQTALGGGGGDNHYTSRANLRTDLALDAIATHYATSMRAASWSQVGEVARPGTVVSTWSRMDGDDLLVAVLSLMAKSDGDYTLGLSLAGPPS